MQRRVTLKQIAERAGVHLSTVSLAMRNDPRLPLKTRQRLQKLAREMGYVPDAAMSALCAYRSAIRPHEIQSGLAFLTDEPARSYPFSSIVYEHARARAAKLGYNLIDFNLQEQSLSQLMSVWWNMGLRGVLIGPFHESGAVLEGEWDRWPVVAFGHSVAAPHFTRASFNHFQNMLTHLEELRKRGYKRIGICLKNELSERTHGQLHAAYLLDQATHGAGPTIPIYSGDAVETDALEAWIKEHELDAIVSYDNTYSVLVQRGWKIPEKLGLSLFSNWWVQKENLFAGMDTKVGLLAEGAVSFLVSLIHEQAVGILNPPRAYMLSGEFCDGRTLRKSRAQR